MKALLVIWLVLPRFQGAAIIYERIIYPYFLEFEDEIDATLRAGSITVRNKSMGFLTFVLKEGLKIAGEQGTQVFTIILTLIRGRKDTSSASDVIVDAMASALVDEPKMAEEPVAAVAMTPTIAVAEPTADFDSDIPNTSGPMVRAEAKDQTVEKQTSTDVRAHDDKLLSHFIEMLDDGVFVNMYRHTTCSSPDPTYERLPRLRLMTISEDRRSILWNRSDDNDVSDSDKDDDQPDDVESFELINIITVERGCGCPKVKDGDSNPSVSSVSMVTPENNTIALVGEGYTIFLEGSSSADCDVLFRGLRLLIDDFQATLRSDLK